MIVSFCGHSNYFSNYEVVVSKLLNILIERLGTNVNVDFYLGEYGFFDNVCHTACLKYKEINKYARLIFVTPYLDDVYLKKRISEPSNFDDVLYFGIEHTPKRFAIVKRNFLMVEKCDLLICFINHTWGGAYNTYLHAKAKKKEIINLANYI